MTKQYLIRAKTVQMRLLLDLVKKLLTVYKVNGNRLAYAFKIIDQPNNAVAKGVGISGVKTPYWLREKHFFM